MAAGLALREAAARMAPALFCETPSFAAMDDCTALKPGCLPLNADFIPDMGYLSDRCRCL